MVPETRIIDKETEPLKTYLPFPDVFVTVNPGPKALFRIIEMEKVEVIEAYSRVEFQEGLVISFRSADVIAGRKSVAGIKTDAKTFSKPSTLEDMSKFLKTAPDTGPLARRGLKKDFHLSAGCLFEHPIQALYYRNKSGL